MFQVNLAKYFKKPVNQRVQDQVSLIYTIEITMLKTYASVKREVKKYNVFWSLDVAPSHFTPYTNKVKASYYLKDRRLRE